MAQTAMNLGVLPPSIKIFVALNSNQNSHGACQRMNNLLVNADRTYIHENKLPGFLKPICSERLKTCKVIRLLLCYILRDAQHELSMTLSVAPHSDAFHRMCFLFLSCCALTRTFL